MNHLPVGSVRLFGKILLKGAAGQVVLPLFPKQQTDCPKDFGRRLFGVGGYLVKFEGFFLVTILTAQTVEFRLIKKQLAVPRILVVE